MPPGETLHAVITSLPCIMKRHASLLSLSREHHTALSLALRGNKLVAAADCGAILAFGAELAARFAQDLAPHFAEEENGLLRELAAAGEASLDRLVRRTLDEHVAMHNLAQRLGTDAGAVGEFCALLQAHVRFEERELFPAHEARLADASPAVGRAA